MYILIAILMFGVLIFVHELGHFLTAKALDVQVNEFSICMGPAIWKKQCGETLYAVRCIPIGGYCAMEGEDEESDNPRAFTAKPGEADGSSFWRRLGDELSDRPARAGHSLLVGRGLFNCEDHWLLRWLPAAVRRGLQVDDELYKIDGRRVFIYSDVGTLLARNKTGKFDLVVKRDGQLVELNDFEMTPRLYTVDGEEQYKYGLYFGAEEKNVRHGGQKHVVHGARLRAARMDGP